jgi:hypothetical protein
MRPVAQRVPLARGNLLPTSPIAAAVANRAERVSTLVLRRRKIALAYRRTRSEDQRIALEKIDQDLAKHNIDIPAVERLAQGKQGGRL